MDQAPSIHPLPYIFTGETLLDGPPEPPTPTGSPPPAHPLVAAARERLRRARFRGGQADEAHALAELGRCLRLCGQPEDALAPLGDALARYEVLDDLQGQGRVHEQLALCRRDRGDLGAALADATTSLAMAEATGAKDQSLSRRGLLATLRLCARAPKDAAPLLTQVVADARALRLPTQLGHALLLLGQCQTELRDLTAARQSFEQAAAVLRRCGQPALELQARSGLAIALIYQGRTDEGTRLLCECAEALRAGRQWLHLRIVAEDLGTVLAARQPEKARRWLDEALAALDQAVQEGATALLAGRGPLLFKLAGACYRTGDRQAACRAFEQALPGFDADPDARALAIKTRVNLGVALIDLGEVQPGLSHIEDALELCRQQDDDDLLGPTLANLGLSCFQTGRRREARRFLREAALLLVHSPAHDTLLGSVRVALQQLGDNAPTTGAVASSSLGPRRAASPSPSASSGSPS